MIGIILLVLCVFAFVLFVKGITRVQEGTCAIVEKNGRHSRTLTPGIHFILPHEEIKIVEWSYPEERTTPVGGEIRIVMTKKCFTCIPMNECILDTVPDNVITADGISVIVNGVIYYEITNPVDAVYRTDDVLKLLCTYVSSCTRVVFSELVHGEVLGKDTMISDMITGRINERIDGYGIMCNRFVIQSLEIPETYRNEIRGQIASEKKNQIAIAEQQHRNELAKKVLEDRMENDIKNSEFKYEMTERERELAKLETSIEEEQVRAKLERTKKRIEILKELGFSNEQIVCLELAPGHFEAISSSNNTFYYSNGHVPILPLLPSLQAEKKTV